MNEEYDGIQYENNYVAPSGVSANTNIQANNGGNDAVTMQGIQELLAKMGITNTGFNGGNQQQVQQQNYAAPQNLSREDWRDKWMSSGTRDIGGLQEFLRQNGGQLLSENGTVRTPSGDVLDILQNARTGNGNPAWTQVGGNGGGNNNPAAGVGGGSGNPGYNGGQYNPGTYDPKPVAPPINYAGKPYVPPQGTQPVAGVGGGSGNPVFSNMGVAPTVNNSVYGPSVNGMAGGTPMGGTLGQPAMTTNNPNVNKIQNQRFY